MQEICYQPFKIDLKCPYHKGQDLIYIQLNINQGQDNKLFYCSECSDEDADYKSTNFITIQKIIQQNQNQILQKWPILNDNKLLNQINGVIDIQNNFDEIVEHINTFFKDLLVQVIEKIDDQKEKMLNQITQIKNYKQDIIKKYVEISKIEEVKSIILSQDLNFQQKKEKYKTLLEQIIQKKEQNSQLLQVMVYKATQIQKIDYDSAEVQKKQILQDLEKINFFQLQKKNENNIINNTQVSLKSEKQDELTKSQPESSGAQAQFAIGLVHQKQITNKALICNLYSQFDCKDNQIILNEGKISKIVQGSNTLMKCDSSLLELRISYDNCFIQISDYPEGKNKYVHIDPTKKSFQNSVINLFIYTKSSQLCITLKEAYEVDKFI